ncbi:hypothetical protein V4U86_19230 [Mycobacterium sp. AMU20-3851]|uniref:hypothetical protein n=1 Tax=Mycobacterium sp. AMU20-3851 TaxID=3122055 RepID=UPI00375418FC
MRQALDADHPLDMLLLVGLMIEVLLPHEFSYAERLNRERLDPDPRIDDAAAVPGPEYTAVLTLVAEMAVVDEHVRQRCRDAVAERTDVLPRWISDLPKLTVGRAVRLRDTFGDLDQVLFEVRLADGRQITCGVMIDHLEFSTVKDVGVWDRPLDAVLVLIDSMELAFHPMEITTADARAWIEQAWGRGLARRLGDERAGFLAVLKWLTDRLPEGGQPHQRGGSDQSAAEVVAAFFASPEGKRFDRAEFGDVLEDLIGMGSGDALRWSGFRIIYAIGDLPDGRAEPLETLLRLPALLRAYVPFAHERSGIGAELTAQTLAMIDEVQQSVEDRFRSGLQQYWDTAG